MGMLHKGPAVPLWEALDEKAADRIAALQRVIGMILQIHSKHYSTYA